MAFLTFELGGAFQGGVIGSSGKVIDVSGGFVLRTLE
jgi:hypothetical protein